LSCVGGVEEGVIGSATDNQKYQCCISKSTRHTNANVTIIIIILYKNNSNFVKCASILGINCTSINKKIRYVAIYFNFFQQE
jgi:transcriptional regulator with PAS, ATPase and Fis domain